MDSQRNWPCNIVKCQDLEGNLISGGEGNNKPARKTKQPTYTEKMSQETLLCTHNGINHMPVFTILSKC